MASGERGRQRFLPPHAGGLPATRHAGSPIETFINQGVFVGSPPPPQSPAPTNQPPPQATNEPQHWLAVPLQDCAKRAGDDGALARSLLDAGAATDAVDRVGRSPLHWACTRGNTSVVMALLDAGADGFARDGSGKTPLHCAAQVGHTPIVLALLEHYGFAPRAVPATPWMAAKGVARPTSTVAAAAAASTIQHDDIPVSIVDAPNAYGSTALHRAAFNGREEVVLALLRGGASVGVVGKSGRSALHLACHNVHAGCVGILLAWGADESATARDGSTPWSELAQAAEERPYGCPRVAKVAILLNAARGSRAWGRRGWLMMLKHRHNRHTIESERGCEVAKDGRDVEVYRLEEKEDADLAVLIEQLLNMGEEGCFRLVIGFL